MDWGRGGGKVWDREDWGDRSGPLRRRGEGGKRKGRKGREICDDKG